MLGYFAVGVAISADIITFLIGFTGLLLINFTSDWYIMSTFDIKISGVCEFIPKEDITPYETAKLIQLWVGLLAARNGFDKENVVDFIYKNTLARHFLWY